MDHNVLILLFLVLSTYIALITAPLTDIALLQQWEAVAAQRVQRLMQVPRLRQVDTDLERYTFHYVDAVGAISYAISMPTPQTPLLEWEVWQKNDFRLINYPHSALSLVMLQVDSHEVADARTQHWRGCQDTGLTLYFDGAIQDCSCEVEGGIVTGLSATLLKPLPR